MPLRESQSPRRDFNWYPATPEKPVEPSFSQVVDSAFYLENDVRAFFDLMLRRKQFKPDEGFNLTQSLKDNDLWDHRWRFVGVESRAEMAAIAGRIKKEDEARRTAAAGGIFGIAAMVAAGVTSPTSLIPLTAGGRGVKALIQGAKYGAIAGGVQEGVLFAAQETRTTGEAVAGVAAASVLGAGLGWGASALSQRARLRAEYDMANAHRARPISELEGARFYMQGTDGAEIHLKPEAGTLRFSRSVPLNLEGEGPIVLAREERGRAAAAYELRTEEALIVSPETLPLIMRKVKEPTSDNILAWAKSEGYDTVAFEGLTEVRRATVTQYVKSGKKQVQFKDLTPEDQALVSTSLTRDIRRRKDGGIVANAPVQVDELAELRRGPQALEIDDHLVILDRSKLRPVSDPDAPMIVPRPGPGFEKVPSSIGSLSAASARPREAGQLKSGAANFLAKTSPVGRGLQRDSPQARYMTANLGTGGMVLEGNVRGIPSAPGGTVEDLVKTWYGKYGQASEAVRGAYVKYFFNDQPAGPFAAQKATLGGLLGRGGKMSRHEFNLEVGRIMFSGDKHEIPEVMEAAQTARKLVYDHGAEEMKRFEIIPEDPDLKGDITYLNRIYKHGAIEAKFGLFVEKLQRNYMSQMVEKFQRGLAGLRKAEEGAQQFEADVKLTTDELREVREQLIEESTLLKRDLRFLEPGEIQAVESVEPAPLAVETQIEALLPRLDTLIKETPGGVLQERLKDVRKLLRKGVPDPAKYDAQLDSLVRAAQMYRESDRAVPDLQPLRDIRQPLHDLLTQRQFDTLPGEERAARAEAAKLRLKAVRKRLSNLNKHRAAFAEKQQKKLDKIERSEELNIKNLNRLVESGRKVLDTLDTVNDATRLAEVSKLRTMFAEIAVKYDRAEERLIAAAAEEPDINRLFQLEGYKQEKAGRLTQIAEDLEDAQNMDIDAIRAAIREGLDEAIAKVDRINSRRSLRAERLRQQADDLDPAKADEILRERQGRMTERRLSFLERQRQLGAEDIDLEQGTVDFSARGRELAEETAHDILGSDTRLAGFDIVQGPRGPEKARMLNIPSEELIEFLEHDIERAMRIYVRTIAPDVEITKKFGSVNGALEFAKLHDERSLRLQAIEERVDLDEPAKEQLRQRTLDEYRKIQRDLEGLIGRLRHTWGVPRDPRSWAYRAARVIMHLNVLRFMGGVVVASIPDVARPVMRQGFLRTFNDGFVPMVTNFKQFKMSARTARLAGVALDPVMHSRARAMFDILDDTQIGTKFERGVEHLTSQMGLIALFDWWTAAWKQFSAGVINMRILDSVDALVNGKNLDEATEFLSSVGIDEMRARRLWVTMNKAGNAERVNGVWVPDVGAWDDPEAVQDFLQALAHEVDATIITPGIERPLVSDKNIPLRMVFQFKSFMLSSTTKTLVAGLQRPDASFILGFNLSMSLGALSYYLWATATGGRAYQEMLAAPPEKWVDEAIDRSGLLGVLTLGREFAQNIPVMQELSQAVPPLGLLSSFSGRQTTRRGGHTLIESAAGPSFDFAQRASQVVLGLDDPTQSTVHAFRTMLPFQNLTYLRKLFDAMEQSINLPERRNARRQRQTTVTPARPQ